MNLALSLYEIGDKSICKNNCVSNLIHFLLKLLVELLIAYESRTLQVRTILNRKQRFIWLQKFFNFSAIISHRNRLA
jgi:hypothetical protein